MENQFQGQQEDCANSDSVSGHLTRIKALKESLKHVHGMSEEIRLLGDLTREISALRQLNEPHYQ